MIGAVGRDCVEPYVPSVRPPVANTAWKGGPTVSIKTQLLAPCARCSNVTDTVSASVVAEIVGEPAIAAPGSSTVGAGDRLSTVTDTGAEVVALPAGSVARTSSCTGPSATLVESQVMLVALPLAITEPLTRKATVNGFASPTDPTSVTLEPLTRVPAVGAPTEAVGAVLSTTTTPVPLGWRSIVETFDATSVICARS